MDDQSGSNDMYQQVIHELKTENEQLKAQLAILKEETQLRKKLLSSLLQKYRRLKQSISSTPSILSAKSLSNSIQDQPESKPFSPLAVPPTTVLSPVLTLHQIKHETTTTMFDLFPQVEKSPNSQNLMTDSKTFDAVSSPSLFPPEQKKSTNHFPIPSSTRVLSLQRQNGQFLLSPPVPILSPPSTRLLSEHSVSPPPVFSPHNPHHPAHHFQNVHSDQPPQTKPKSVKFVTSERRKFHRENMKGHVCEKCGNFAAICEQLGVHQHHTDFSRHRHHHTPPATPDAYWDLSLGDSEGIQEENSAEEIESDVDGEWRESDEGEKREKVDP